MDQVGIRTFKASPLRDEEIPSLSITFDREVPAFDGLKGLEANIMVVSYSDDDNPIEMPPENRQKVLDKGATLFNAPSLTFSLDRAFGTKYEESGPSYFIELGRTVQ